jgi:hypothetical protein
LYFGIGFALNPKTHIEHGESDSFKLVNSAHHLSSACAKRALAFVICTGVLSNGEVSGGLPARLQGSTAWCSCETF